MNGSGKSMARYGYVYLLVSVLIWACGGCSGRGGSDHTVHVGYFPNITHAQAIIGLSNNVFASHLGADVEIKATIFNAGPAIIEAVFAEDIDIAYVGPSPAINGYVRSGGKALKVVSGVASGGALFVVRPESNIKTASDLYGKRIASPQLGNTQDIAIRGYLRNHGLMLREAGGTVSILPLRNPEILNLFMRKQIDGAWVPEPWGVRLIREGGGVLFLDEKTLWADGRFSSAVIVVRTNFLKRHPERVKKWLAAHVEITNWINQHPEEAKAAVCSRIKAISGIYLPKEIIDEAFRRIEATYDPIVSSLFSYAEMAYNAGFLGKQRTDLSGLVDLSLLNEALKEGSLLPVGE